MPQLIASAEPFIAPGDVWLRDDLQRLSDAGVITSPLSSWPLSLGDVVEDINAYTGTSDLSIDVQATLTRFRRYANRHMEVGFANYSAGAQLTERPQRIRGFGESSRGTQELWVAADFTGERFAGKLQGSYVGDDPTDNDAFRLDGSYATMAVGNWIVSASVQDRHWGPGWNSSLLLSSNARPIPALTIQRNYSSAPKSRWLRWVGPWSTKLIWGQLENNRPVPNARLFAWRANARPLPGLEIGVQRAIQWCGSGRDCSTDAFVRSILGDTNSEEGIANDAANQLAGFDLRWASPIGNWPYALYGNFIGEDEAGGFPSKYLGQMGAEVWGYTHRWSIPWRAYVEYADTTCQFNEASKQFNCAYNNTAYPDGYRYRGRALGHSSDNDAESFAVGLITQMRYGKFGLTARHMRLNRGGSPDPSNSISSVPLDQTDFDLNFRRDLAENMTLDFKIGVVHFDGDSNSEETNLRASLGIYLNL